MQGQWSQTGPTSNLYSITSQLLKLDSVLILGIQGPCLRNRNDFTYIWKWLSKLTDKILFTFSGP